MAYFSARERSRQGHPPWLFLWRCRRLLLERFDLEADRLDIRIDALIQERALHRVHLLTTPIEAIALQDRHLVRELVDLQLLSLDLRVAFGNQRRVCAAFGIELGDQD